MHIRFKGSALARTALIATLASPLMAVTCGDATGPGGFQGCSTTKDAAFPTNGNFEINKPATCPMKFPSQNFPVDYAATGTIPSGQVTPYQYQLSVTDRNGYEWGASVSNYWNLDGANWIVAVSGQYTGAQGGFDAQDNGYDIANNQIYVNGQWVASHTKLTYTFGDPSLNVIGPSSGIGAYVTYTLNTSTDDPSFVSPVNWTWTLDGTVVSTDGPSLDWQAGEPGTTQSFRIDAVDANGLSHTQYRDVTTCDSTQFDC